MGQALALFHRIREDQLVHVDGEPRMNEEGPMLFARRVANRLGRPLGINPFPRAFPNPTTSAIAARADVFDSIYQSNFWGSGESRSGVGSERDFSGAYLARLRLLLEKRSLRRLFDAPCGDLNWSAALTSDPAVDYAGGDISASLIADLQRRFPRVDLRVFDICTDPFPDADVWHCRDCLFHLPLADIRSAFENFARSSIPFALLTTHRARWLHRNLDVPLGGFRFLDLERAPIGLGEAEEYLPDYRKGSDFPRYVGLWPRDAIAKAFRR